jgi:ABC-type antimicrobial peptide transport system permease subunit
MLQALRFSLQDMAHDRSRTLLSVTGLAVVIASYFILSGLSRAFASYLNITLASRNLVILQKGLYDPSDAQLEPEVIQAVQELIPSMVSRISPAVYRYTRVGEHVVPLGAAAQEDWEAVYHLKLIKGAWPAGEREIVVNEGIAQVSDWDLGSIVQIFGSGFSVSGIFRVPGSAFASVWMPIQTYWALFDTQRGYQGLFVQATVGVDPDDLFDQLQADPRLADGYTIYFEDNYARRYNRILKDMSSLMIVGGRISLLGIIFGIFNAVTLSTIERSRELGILLGIGFSHSRLRGFILVRSLILGLLAYAVGLAAASVYAIIQQALAPLFIFGFSITLKITPGMAVTGLAWVIGMAFLGAWLSTRRLFKLQVVGLLSER